MNGDLFPRHKNLFSNDMRDFVSVGPSDTSTELLYLKLTDMYKKLLNTSQQKYQDWTALRGH